MNLVGIDNAIAWAQFQLRGGWRNLLSVVGLYAGVVVALIVLSTRLGPPGSGASLATWTMLLLVAQAAILILYIPSRVGTAIRTDLTGGILESHRLMPLPPSAAVAGYVWGPAATGLALAAATLIIGAVSGAGAGITLDRWIIPNLVLFEFAAFVVVLSVFSAFLGQASAVWVIIIGLNLWAGVNVGQAFPGLVVLLSPLIGDSVFGWRTGTVEIGWPVAASMLSHVAIGAIFFAGAARKYCRADQPALGVVLALALLAAWVGVSALGISHWSLFQPRFMSDINRLARLDPPVQLIASLIAAMLLACVPLTNAARGVVRWRQRVLHDELAPRRRPFPPPFAVALVAAGIMLLLPAIVSIPPMEPQGSGADRLARTAIVLVSHCLGVAFFQRVALRFTARRGLLALLLVLLWAGPVIADVARAVLEDRQDSPLGVISTMSPAGALIALWHNADVSTTFGLVVQATLAAVLGLLARVTEPRRRTSG